LAQLSQLTEGKLPLIGVGGISSAEDAWQKLLAGASALQLYSALVYQGMSLVPEVLRGLEDRVKKAGLANVSEAVGTGRGAWL
jgi:dihydroorotate dehydrogenase